VARRIIAILLLLACAVFLASCGGNAASAPTPTATATPPVTPPAATPTPPSNPTPVPPTPPPPPPTPPPPPPTPPPPPPTPAPSSAPSCNYSYATFKDASGADAKFLYGNNDNGAMVGIDSANRGFLVQNGQFTFLNVPASFGATNSTDVKPDAIANNGLVVGEYVTGDRPNVTTHGVIYNNGQYTSFEAPNANTTIPAGISSDGTVVGNGHIFAAAYGSNWIRRPDGSFGTLSDGTIPEGLRTAGDINDSDIVVLDASSSSAHRNDYATWQNGAFTYHPFPSAIGFGSPVGNNNLGDVVGVTQNNGVLTAWALLGSSTSCSIAYPGATTTFAEDINNPRVIVGYYVGADSQPHAFIATPK
jgi:hypothetical protein